MILLGRQVSERDECQLQLCHVPECLYHRVKVARLLSIRVLECKFWILVSRFVLFAQVRGRVGERTTRVWVAAVRVGRKVGATAVAVARGGRAQVTRLLVISMFIAELEALLAVGAAV